MPIRTPEDYVASLRGRNLTVYFLGEKIPEPVDHPCIRPSINAVAETYRLAMEEPALASATSTLSGRPVNRFLHVTQSANDVVMQTGCSGRWDSARVPAFSAVLAWAR